MAITPVSIPFDVSDILGVDYDARRTKLFIRTNIDGDVIVDADGNTLRVGTAYAKPDDNGVGSFDNLIPTNAATNPTDFQYEVVIDYPPRDPKATQHNRWSSGWFSLTATTNLADVIAEQYVPPTFMTTATNTLQGYVDQGKAYRDDQAAIAGLTGEDSAVANLVNNTSSSTRGALNSAYGAVLVASATSATADQSATIQGALNFSTALTLRGGTFRADSTIELVDNQRLRLETGVTLKRTTDSASTEPVVWLRASNAVLEGAGVMASHVRSDNPSPNGVVCVGYKGTADTTARTANFNTVQHLDLVGQQAGGQTSGTPDIVLQLCNNQVSSQTSYFNRVNDLRLANANTGLAFVGWANANQVHDLTFYQVGNNGTLSGAAIKFMASGAMAPLENQIDGIFHHGSSNATTININCAANYNSLTSIISEQGGATAKFLTNSDDTATGNYIQGIDNVSGGSSVTANFYAKNTVINSSAGGRFSKATIASLTATDATVTGGFTQDIRLTKTVTLTGLAEGAKVNFLKVTAPAGPGAYRIDVDVRMSSSTNANTLQTSVRASYLLRCTSTSVTVVEMSTEAPVSGSYLPPVVSSRDVTFAVQMGTNGTSTTNGVLRATYVAPTTLTITEVSDTSTATSTYRDHFLLRSANGTTAQRPTTRGKGDYYHDNDLGKPVFSDGTNWNVVAYVLTKTQALDFPSIAAGGSQELTITLPGVAVNDAVSLGAPAAIEAGLVWNAYISAADTIKVRVSNITAAAIDPVSGTWRVTVAR